MRELFKESKKRKFEMPHAYVVLFIILIIVSVLTYIIPAGSYERVIDETGQEAVVPDSFRYIEKTPVPIWRIPNYIMESFELSADLIFGVLIIGAGLEVVLSTGMFHAFCSHISKLFRGKERYFVPMLLLVFALIGVTQSTNKFIGFTPLGVMLAAMLGYDAVVGVSLVMLGIGIGFTSGVLAANTAIAQGLVGLPAYSGISMRIAAFMILYIITAIYLVRYAEGCRRDERRSVLYGYSDIQTFEAFEIEKPIETRHWGVLMIFLISMAILIYGCLSYGWALTENAIVFIWMGILSGFVYGYGPSRIAKEFINGAKGMISAALILGLGGTCTLIMNEANILDTVVMVMASGMELIPHILKAPALMLINMVVSVFVTSGAGHAAVVMPILSPVADLSGISRQSLVLSYRLGDGICGYAQPHSGSLMPYIAAAGIPYDLWMRFFFKLWVLWIGAGSIIMMICVLIGY